jgi:hypothetical protein
MGDNEGKPVEVEEEVQFGIATFKDGTTGYVAKIVVLYVMPYKNLYDGTEFVGIMVEEIPMELVVKFKPFTEEELSEGFLLSTSLEWIQVIKQNVDVVADPYAWQEKTVDGVKKKVKKLIFTRPEEDDD